jgi:hypothetical protein
MPSVKSFALRMCEIQTASLKAITDSIESHLEFMKSVGLARSVFDAAEACAAHSRRQMKAAQQWGDLALSIQDLAITCSSRAPSSKLMQRLISARYDLSGDQNGKLVRSRIGTAPLLTASVENSPPTPG